MASFWQTVAVYCDHLAPVAGPLLSSAGRTAASLHNAEIEAREINERIAMYRNVPVLSPIDEDD